MTARGCFVVIEGPEGAGKSTLVRSLFDRLTRHGKRVDAQHEPGGTRLGYALRQIVLDPAESPNPETELFLILAARADLCEKWVRPGLAAGTTLLLDRFELSTFAYQVAGRGLARDVVAAANRLATGGLVPDAVLVLDLDRTQGVARQAAQGKGLDRLEQEAASFHDRVHAEYRAFRGPGVVHLDASAGPETVAESAWRALAAIRPDIFA